MCLILETWRYLHCILNLWLHSLWPNDAIWGHRTGSALAQVLACAWWHKAITWASVGLLIKGVLWQSPERRLTRSVYELNPYMHTDCTIRTTNTSLWGPTSWCMTVIFPVNNIWWLCLVPTSTTRFASDEGYRMAQNWYGYLRKFFLWTMTSNSLT